MIKSCTQHKLEVKNEKDRFITKKIGLLLIGLTIAIFADGQIVKIQGGTSISKLDWIWKEGNEASLYEKTLIGYSIFAGIDYFEKQYFNLSSNMGVIREGGESEFHLVK